MKELMLKIDNVSKQYKLGQIGGTTLKAELQRKRALRRGEEDPYAELGRKNNNAKIGEKFLALDGVSFEIKKGERVGIIGHNGAGKSTLLKLISRVTAPTEGTIYLNGRVASMLEVGTGFHGELTGRENIYMNGAILGMTKKEIDAKIEDIIDFSECRQFIDTPVKRYSSGMYVKLAFSVAAHLDSEIMIMDEVLAVGDMTFQKKCLDKMNDVSRKDGRTILYVSHNMNTIRQLCNRCIVLDHGKVVFDGDAEKGITHYVNNNDYGDNKIQYQFKPNGRNQSFDNPIMIEQLKILDRNSNIVQSKEILKCKICCKSEQEFHNLKMRFEILYEDESIVGTIFSDEKFDVQKNEEFDIYCEMQTDNFAPGRYKCIALIFTNSEYGNQEVLARVEPAMFFEIMPNENDNITWLHSYWGHTRFDDLKIEKQ